MGDAYRDDLAYIHDAGFGGIARAAAPVLLDALQHQRILGGLVVDLGCGSGLLAQAVSDAGYEVLGIDISEAMAALAQVRATRSISRGVAPDARRSLPALPSRPSASASTTSSTRATTSRRSPSSSGGSTMPSRRMDYSCLTWPGPVGYPGRARGDFFAEGDDWAVLSVNEEDRRREILTRRITSFRKVGDHYRRDHEIHRQRLLKRQELALQLRKTGFRVRILAGYGPLRFGPGQHGLMARKPRPARRG